MSRRLRDIHGWLLDQKRRNREGLEARLTRMVHPLGGPNDCIVWVGALNNACYGQMSMRWRGEHWLVHVHRLFWVLANGRNIPRGYVPDHSCGTRPCVNPRHLELVSEQVNNARVFSMLRWERMQEQQELDNQLDCGIMDCNRLQRSACDENRDPSTDDQAAQAVDPRGG